MASSRRTWRHRASRLFWSLLPEKTRLLHRLGVMHRLYDPEIEEAERKGHWDKRNQMVYEAAFETEPIHGRLKELGTEYWRRKAHRYHVPVPERKDQPDENWHNIESTQEGITYWYLTETGIFRVRGPIRDEQKYRRESRLAYLTALTGIGALIGVLTALSRFSK